MPWVEIELPEDLELAERKLRLLADEDVDEALVEALRLAGMDVITVNEVGYRGRDDEDIYRFAYKEGRVLLTFNGRDYLDHTRFPFHSCAGVLWLDFGRQTLQLAEACSNIRSLGRCGDWKAKIRLKPRWEFDVWSRGPDGKVEKRSYRFVGTRTEEWVQEGVREGS